MKLGCECKQGHWAFIQGIEEIRPDPSNLPLPVADIRGLLTSTANSLEKTLMLGKIEGRRRKGRQMMGWMDGIMDSVDMNLSKLQKIVEDSEACAAVHGVAKSRTSLSN